MSGSGIDYQTAYEVRVTVDVLKNSIKLIEEIGRHANGVYSDLARDVAMELAERCGALQRADARVRKPVGSA